MRRNLIVGQAMILLLLAAAVAAQTPLLGPEFPVNAYTTGSQKRPAVAIDPNGNFIVTWHSNNQDGSQLGVFAQRYDIFGAPQGPEFQVNTTTTGYQYEPSVATDNAGDFVIVWASDSLDGSDSGIAGQRYDSAGNPLGGEFQINTYTTDYQFAPRVAMSAAGSFVVVWTSTGQDGSSDGVFGQRYDGSGAAQGLEFQVNTTTTDYQEKPAVATDAAGDFVVVWDSGSAATGYDVFAQRYSSSGMLLGTEFRVNAYTGVAARNPAVATDNDGDFVVVWQQYDASGVGIFGQRFESSGIPEGSQFQINTFTVGPQRRPAVALDANHEFVVCWESRGQDDPTDPNTFGIFGQRFGDPNVPVGSEFPLNVFTTGDQQRPAVAMNGSGNFVVAWDSLGQDGSGYGILARRSEFHAAQPMAVDAHGSGATSNLNGVLEPGETVGVEPSWQNTLTTSLTFTATASNLTGPIGGVYAIMDGSADYGTVPVGDTTNCYDATAGHDCYLMTVAGARPGAHWDATFTETLDFTNPPGTASKVWTLHVGESFPDVPTSNLFYKFIESLFHNGVTGGCGGGSYCPTNSVTRAQMAVFLLKAKHGSSFVPPACTGIFPDVPCPSLFADWIEQLFAEGVTGGCGGGNYCPDNPVRRDQMAAFLLKAEHGSSFVPPACTGIFPDVPCPSLFADWIEQLFAEGITGGCGGGNYCPLNPNTRGQMAVFLVKTFGLQLYGP
ncbi:MAG TPA: S-layer homology domain-containing protein [Thermoanaerobaculia bacterium]|jgi:hypothetical protein